MGVTILSMTMEDIYMPMLFDVDPAQPTTLRTPTSPASAFANSPHPPHLPPSPRATALPITITIIIDHLQLTPIHKENTFSLTLLPPTLLTIQLMRTLRQVANTHRPK